MEALPEPLGVFDKGEGLKLLEAYVKTWKY